MEARLHRVCAALLLTALLSPPLHAAGYRTVKGNFTVDAPTPELAREIGEKAEHWRRELAVEWLGQELPNWSRPCPIKAKVSPRLGAGGATSFVFNQGEVFNWRMNIQGSRERILDSVLPHEVMHTIIASHFRQPLPRWADEGACTTVEHQSEISKQETMLIKFLRGGKGIDFNAMFRMSEYPKDVMPLYAQGHSLAKFLITKYGKREFMAFLGDGLDYHDWSRAVREHYGHPHLLALQNSWMNWIRQGRPELSPSGDNVLVASHVAPLRPISPPIVRGQDPAAGSVYSAAGGSKVGPTPGTSQDWPIENTRTGSVYDASRETGTTLR